MNGTVFPFSLTQVAPLMVTVSASCGLSFRVFLDSAGAGGGVCIVIGTSWPWLEHAVVTVIGMNASGNIAAGTRAE